MEAKFSPQVKDVIQFSREEAMRFGHNYIGVEHLLLGILRETDCVAMQILRRLLVDTEKVRRQIEQAIKSTGSSSNPPTQIPLVKQAERVLKITYLEAKAFLS